MMARKTPHFALAALGLAGLLAGCADEAPKHLQPLSYAAQVKLKLNGLSEDAPILVRIFKEESELEVWKQGDDGKYKLVTTYPICTWSGVLGPKQKEGDRQAPEGFYTIRPVQMNPWSNFYLSFNLGYPNVYDKAHGRTGAHLMVHGACSSAGCYSMTDEYIADIYAFAREAFNGGQEEFQVQAFPFRMTDENMARHVSHEWYPFWQNLKEGHDAFEVASVPPKVDVCDKRYVFNASFSVPDGKLDPAGPCPPMTPAPGFAPTGNEPQQIAKGPVDPAQTVEASGANTATGAYALAGQAAQSSVTPAAAPRQTVVAPLPALRPGEAGRDEPAARQASVAARFSPREIWRSLTR